MPGGEGQVRPPRLPEAGWLPDPALVDVERYWDGHRWSAHTRDRDTKLEFVDPLWTAAEHLDRRRTDVKPIDPRFEAIPELPGVPAAAATHPHSHWVMGFALVGVVAAGTIASAGLFSGTLSWGGGGSAVPAGPAVDYPVFGSDALSLYLARSLVAQEQTIDLSWIAVDGDEREALVEDALLEVAAQNPYVYIDPDAAEFAELGDALTPAYSYTDTQAAMRRERTASTVDVIVQSEAVAGAVGDVATAAALYDALIDATEYDADGAFSSGSASLSEYEAYGALVDGVAVGEGYALAFQALAEAAGLTSVVVTGTAYDGDVLGQHAWNKVLIGGAWLVADAAYDDLGELGASHDYFLIADSNSAMSSRAADSDWVADDLVWTFGS
ncbi:DUF2510 domain-containing protein [Demequina salsinemoris]|uniref:DUF2510 domain-containing protein n=1 Tax=Demequina salsinemoris TaxID=577470 RepID=UPI0007857387|nr:DUF2510 domain-containing protein [Demequina salsinemoris]